MANTEEGMGRSQADTARGERNLDALDPQQKKRFATYFPKVFAYAHSWTGDDARSREIVIEAFARAFGRGAVFGEEDFTVVLFTVTRDLCAGARRSSRPPAGGLSDPEREVLALLFDAQLTRDEVGRLLRMPEEAVVSTLIGGLRKLKTVVKNGVSAPLHQH
jgi:DNA-directed RNA polymerase specialized sigma24 family protein